MVEERQTRKVQIHQNHRQRMWSLSSRRECELKAKINGYLEVEYTMNMLQDLIEAVKHGDVARKHFGVIGLYNLFKKMGSPDLGQLGLEHVIKHLVKEVEYPELQLYSIKLYIRQFNEGNILFLFALLRSCYKKIAIESAQIIKMLLGQADNRQFKQMCRQEGGFGYLKEFMQRFDGDYQRLLGLEILQMLECFKPQFFQLQILMGLIKMVASGAASSKEMLKRYLKIIGQNTYKVEEINLLLQKGFFVKIIQLTNERDIDKECLIVISYSILCRVTFLPEGIDQLLILRALPLLIIDFTYFVLGAFQFKQAIDRMICHLLGHADQHQTGNTFIQRIMSVLSCDTPAVRLSVCQFFNKIITVLKIKTLKRPIQKETQELLFNCMTSDAEELVQGVLDCLSQYLEVGCSSLDEYPWPSNPTIDGIRCSEERMAVLNKLMGHSSGNIKLKAVNIYHKYFSNPAKIFMWKERKQI